MANRSALANLLKRAGRVFSLAGELARHFDEERQQQGSKIDATGWEHHRRTFEEFCEALANLRKPIENPPDGFEAVADKLNKARRTAKRIRDQMKTAEGRDFALYQDCSPELNSASLEGWRAVKDVGKALEPDDPLAFATELAADGAASSFYLHYPGGHCTYIVIADSQRRPFDFSDNTFKPASDLGNLRDACLYANGRPEESADHAYSYTVEFDLTLLLAGSDAETVPTEGSVVSIHWLVQVGDEPDVKVDLRRDCCRLRLVSCTFEPIDPSSRDQLDENTAFEKRARFAKEYREFVLKEIDEQDHRLRRLARAVRAGDASKTLRVLAEDLCFWAGNLKQHLLHHISHQATDPSFVRMVDVPEGAAFQLLETWIARDWLGRHESFDLLEFHKGAEYARSFSARLDRLHEARIAFAKLLVRYTVETRGEDVESTFALDEIRKDLKHKALCLAEHLDRIAMQFDAESSSRHHQSPPSVGLDQSAHPSLAENKNEEDPKQFTGGKMVFHADRVELCGVDICSGPRSARQRKALDLFRSKKGGRFVAFSGTILAKQLGLETGQNGAAGVVRGLRTGIKEALLNKANIECGDEDVILSRGPGYRFSEKLSVHVGDAEGTRLQSHDTAHVDQADQVRDTVNDPVRDPETGTDDPVTARRTWILHEVGNGRKLRSPHIAKELKCSVPTAKRDLTALKEEGKIEFVGASRTGHYRLRQPPGADQ